jgi:hypothetical protein
VHDAAFFVRGGDIQEYEFVGTRFVVEFGLFYGIAGVHDIDESDAFHDPPLINIEARDDPFGYHKTQVNRV